MMTPTPNPAERINELEKEVKDLTRLAREAKAREKVTSTRLMLMAKDMKTMMTTIKDLQTKSKLTGVALAQVQSKK